MNFRVVFMTFSLLFVSQLFGQSLKELPDAGITPSLTYEGEIYSNIDGGVKRGTVYVGNLHLQCAIDGGRLAGWEESSLFIDGLWITGGQPSDLTGDAQGASNIEGPVGWEIYEAWIQQNLLSDHLSILAGLYDLNIEFYNIGSAGLFRNSSFGIGPEFSETGIEGPSIFPRTSFGLRFTYKPTERVGVKLALMDGVPWQRAGGVYAAFQRGDGLLIVSEAALLTEEPGEAKRENHRLRIGRLADVSAYETKLAVGVWHYTAAFDDLSESDETGEPVERAASSGVYLLADRLLYKAGGRRLSGFIQLGAGDPRVDRFAGYVGAGIFVTGLFDGRAADQAGIAVAAAYNGSHYLEGQERAGEPANKFETVIELTYLLQGTDWLAVQPDIQYVISPGTGPLRNALVGQLLAEISI